MFDIEKIMLTLYNFLEWCLKYKYLYLLHLILAFSNAWTQSLEQFSFLTDLIAYHE